VANRVQMVVAMARNGVIGIEDRLPWQLRADLMRFKRLTMGHCLFMGRKTFESIGKPLPGRETIVLTRQAVRFRRADAVPGLRYVESLEEGLEGLAPEKILFVVGGAEIYRQFFHCVSEVHLTRVLADVSGDARLDPLPLESFELVELESFPADLQNQWPSRYERWVRVVDSNVFSTSFGNIVCS
jgi:dihydrofolate reductase